MLAILILATLCCSLLPTTTGAMSVPSSPPAGSPGECENVTSVNHLIPRDSLTQSYFALRHGQSLANVAKIISSDPKISTVEHGLSDVGKDQAKVAGESFASAHIGEETTDRKCMGVAVFSSDFKRARETASIFANELARSGVTLYNGGDIVLEERLRERYFGELNGGSDSRYGDVWEFDATDPDHGEFGAESPNAVLARTTRLIAELEERLGSSTEEGEDGSYWKCVLVAHGDVLQIMQTGFLKHEDASRHRSLRHLDTATIRELPLAS